MEEEDRKALIVHPDHRHTLPRGPVRHCFWEKLPTDVIACVAYHLPTHVDVCTFELVCRQARSVTSRGTPDTE